MEKIFNSVDYLVGNTPLVELKNLAKSYNLKARILAKLESFNPTGSIKDRVAKHMLDMAEKQGIINKNSVIIEPTSGNTGIGLASIATARGYKSIIVMPDNMSRERIALIKGYGAEVVLTDGKKGMAGAIAKAREIKENTLGGFIPDQFNNEHNPQAHYLTTGPEIYEQTLGSVDILVAGIGTGGTITGTSKFLKSKNPNIKVYGVEPASSPILTLGTAGSHKIQGIGAGFVPKILDISVVDSVIAVTDEDAFNYARLLGKEEGILAGISSGASLSVAIKLAKDERNKDKTIVVILPDGGEKYLSTELFNGEKL